MRVFALVLALVCATLLGTPASADPASVMSGRKLGITTQTDAGNQLHVVYTRATGLGKTLMERSANRSRLRWYGSWSGTGADLEKRLRKYIDNVQAGDPEVVVPLATFRVKLGNRKKVLTAKDKADYRAWYLAAVKAIGNTPTVIVMEPDLPLILPRHGARDTNTRLALVRQSVARLEALPNTDVYIDTGSADWLSIPESVALLTKAGVAQATGFALGATHYDSTADNIGYSRRLSIALAEAGIPGKRSVIDTADNGRPFTHAQYKALQKSKDRINHFDNADVCVNLTQTRCNTLGIPPTTDVANPRWGHTATQNAWARQFVDGYLWFGRPWLKMQADPFCRARALQVGRTTPWAPKVAQLTPAKVRSEQSTCFAKP